MIKIGEKYYIIRDYPNSTEIHEYRLKKAFNGPINTFVFQLSNNPQSICGSEKIVYPTPYDGIYISYTGGFNMDTGVARDPVESVSKFTYTNFNNSKKLIGETKYQNGVPKTEINYEAHIGTKFDYYEYSNIQRIQLLDLQMIKTDCAIERSIMHTNLAYSHNSPRMAGFLLTNNRSMFLETNDNVAWLYHCPQYFSPLQIMDKCFKRIPIMYQNKVHFVDPITRKTYTSAEEQSCADKHDNLFQLDIEKDNSWVELTPSITKVDGPAVFAPHLSSQKLQKYKFQNSHDISLYTAKQMRDFWRNIEFNNDMKDVIKSFTKELVISQDESEYRQNHHNYYPMRTFYLDSFISSDFFNNRYIQMFGHVQYIIEKCGIYFAAFVFIKLIIDTIKIVYRTLQLRTVTDGSVHFGRVLFSAVFDIISLSILTSIFIPQEVEKESTEPLVQTINKNKSNHKELDAPCYKETQFHLYPHIQNQEYSIINQNNDNNNHSGDAPIPPI